MIKRSLATGYSLIFGMGLHTQAFADTTIGSGKIKEEARTVGSFNEISVATGLHVTVTPSQTISLKIKGDDNLLPLVETDVSGGELKIRLKKGSSIRSSNPIEIIVTAPAIQKLSATGGSHLTNSSPAKENFSVESAGGSHITIKDLAVKELKIEASGGSSVNIEGKVDKMRFEGSGGTQLQADKLLVGTADVAASGGTQVHIKQSPKVTGKISGGSMIFTAKDASVDVEKTGGSQILKE